MPRRTNEARRTAADPTTSVETLTTLAHSTDKYVLSAVAANPSLPSETLHRLSSSPDKYVRKAVADNPSTSALTLSGLAVDSDDYVRSAVAKHPQCGHDVLRLLADSLQGPQDQWVLKHLTSNPATPEDVLLDLISRFATGDGTMLDALAQGLRRRNPPARSKIIEVTRFDGRRSSPHLIEVPIEEAGRFSQAVMAAMVETNNQSLVNLAVSQPDAPTHLLARVAAWPLERWKWTVNRIADNPGAHAEVLVRIVETGDNDLLLTINRRPDLPWDLVEALMVHGGPKVQSETCHRDEETLHALAQHTDEQMRQRVARAFNGSTDPRQVATTLMGDPSRGVRAAAAPRVGVANLTHLLNHADLSLEGRLALAEQTRETDILTRLASDAQKTVRRRVVRNRACPLEAIMTLSGDPDPTVRRYAAERVTAALDSLA